ncbi:DUF2382 domain-containing protein [Mucilaginibacter sp. CSA2-8R]|uniref:DUF2382 domain-containing protein n=1 Tax=Mucilaginibacter sp. CSA2-8R TaxID=3141542 RepID=UPI00315D4E46
MAYDNDNEQPRLQELGGSDYEIVDGQYNIKGWEVKNEQNQVIGDVTELLFDPISQRVRYMIVDTDANDLRLNARKILIPIGLAELHEKDDDVIVPNVTASQIQDLPDYTGLPVDTEAERLIVDTFDRPYNTTVTTPVATEEVAAPAGQNFYEHQQFNQNRLYNRRTPVTDAQVTPAPVHPGHTIIKEYNNEPLTDNTTVAEQDTTYHGTPATQNSTAAIEQAAIGGTTLVPDNTAHNKPVSTSPFETFKEGNMEITEHREVPVVSKQARVVEEVNVNRSVDEREETVRDTVRNTEVNTDRIEQHKDRNDPLI